MAKNINIYTKKNLEKDVLRLILFKNSLKNMYGVGVDSAHGDF